MDPRAADLDQQRAKRDFVLRASRLHLPPVFADKHIGRIEGQCVFLVALGPARKGGEIKLGLFLHFNQGHQRHLVMNLRTLDGYRFLDLERRVSHTRLSPHEWGVAIAALERLLGPPDDHAEWHRRNEAELRELLLKPPPPEQRQQQAEGGIPCSKRRRIDP